MKQQKTQEHSIVKGLDISGTKWQVAATPIDRQHHLAKDTEEDICIERPLVSLIHDDSRVIVQVTLSQRLSQEHTISHIFDDCIL